MVLRNGGDGGSGDDRSTHVDWRTKVCGWNTCIVERAAAQDNCFLTVRTARRSLRAIEINGAWRRNLRCVQQSMASKSA